MGDRIIVSVSGGKDSVATALHLRELGHEFDMVFMDTGWEHPDLYTHLDYLEGVLGPIHRVSAKIPDLPAEVLPDVEAIEQLVGRSPSAFVRWTAQKAMFPSRRVRWCTSKLKVRPFLDYVESLDEDIINAVGIRADESAARAKLPERELMPGAEHIEVWRPIIRWTEAQVIEIHQRHGVKPCPLYLRGSTRVGCWPCIQSNKAELSELAKDARRVLAIEALEALTSRLAADRARSKGVEPGNPPTMFQTTLRDSDGVRPCIPIRDMLEWSQTKHGGRQMMLVADWGREAGCVRWGMCESPTSGGK
jgi:3'-phosphoadenosine 5'-phosphosulfate sulfotransferase (PAPS reductase)/FAD synthetase